MFAILGKKILKAIEILFFLGVEEVKEESRLVIYFISSPQLLKTVDNSVDNLWKTEGKTQKHLAGVKKEGFIPALFQTFPQKSAEKKYIICNFAPK